VQRVLTRDRVLRERRQFRVESSRALKGLEPLAQLAVHPLLGLPVSGLLPVLVAVLALEGDLPYSQGLGDIIRHGDRRVIGVFEALLLDSAIRVQVCAEELDQHRIRLQA